MTKVFIDGSAGTTGLRIYERLSERKDIELIRLSEEVRKDPEARKDALNSSDISFLCLPDAAAEEAVHMVTDPGTVIIDTSTAHRTSQGWTYGFPELKGYRERIASSKRIANPGCHASGFIALIEPLVRYGVVDRTSLLSCFSLTGYSGGGKKMIADYEDADKGPGLQAPRAYALTQKHKHLPEMAKICGLENAPLFIPIVSSYYAGMQVMVQLFEQQINGDAETIKEIYDMYYSHGLIRYDENADGSGFMSAGSFSGRDDMLISMFAENGRITLVSRFDNLGKGASGAAIQNMNLVMGADEAAGLVIGGEGI